MSTHIESLVQEWHRLDELDKDGKQHLGLGQLQGQVAFEIAEAMGYEATPEGIARACGELGLRTSA